MVTGRKDALFLPKGREIQKTRIETKLELKNVEKSGNIRF